MRSSFPSQVLPEYRYRFCSRKSSSGLSSYLQAGRRLHCVGQKGLRVQAVVDELRGEKIDIVKWNEDPAKYIANSLSPAKVVSVAVNEEKKMSRVIVPDYQLSLAIGKEGQNARLAAKLTGWKIDIKSETQAGDDGRYAYPTR